jgi:hypothetical protein
MLGNSQSIGGKDDGIEKPELDIRRHCHIALPRWELSLAAATPAMRRFHVAPTARYQKPLADLLLPDARIGCPYPSPRRCGDGGTWQDQLS